MSVQQTPTIAIMMPIVPTLKVHSLAPADKATTGTDYRVQVWILHFTEASSSIFWKYSITVMIYWDTFQNFQPDWCSCV